MLSFRLSRLRVDFGGAAGERAVFLLDNPEVGTLARHVGA